jgi:hypothetical protein
MGEMQFWKSFTAAAVAISMAGTPALAQSSAAPLSLANSVSRSSATTHRASDLNRQALIGVFVVAALILAAFLIPEITKPDKPSSP